MYLLFGFTFPGGTRESRSDASQRAGIYLLIQSGRGSPAGRNTHRTNRYFNVRGAYSCKMYEVRDNLRGTCLSAGLSTCPTIANRERLWQGSMESAGTGTTDARWGYCPPATPRNRSQDFRGRR